MFVKRMKRGAVIAVLALFPALASAQSIFDVELGGGMHFVTIEYHDASILPTGPTAGVGVVHWRSNGWGIVGRFTNTLASLPPRKYKKVVENGVTMIVPNPAADTSTGGTEEDGLSYIHLMARYRWQLAGGRQFHLGVGGVGIIRRQVLFPKEGKVVGGVWYAFDFLLSQPVTDNLDIRFGAQTFPPFMVHPMAAVAWTFGTR